MESNGWKLVTIDEVCTVTDCQHNTAPVVDYETEYRMLRTTNIRNGRLRDIESTKSVTKEIYDRWSVRGYLQDGDVILTREAPMGEVAIIKDEKYKFFLGQRLLQLKVKEEIITPDFLYYSLQTRKVQHQIMMNEGTGSVVSNIRIPLLKKIQLYVPDIDTQKKITYILEAIDLKYNNNNSLLRTLEKIAQTLFKQWFIDFEFPNEEELPYKTSGGKMVKSELGEIPEGWKRGAIKDICLVSSEKVNLDKENRVYNYIGLEHMPQGNIALENWEGSEKVSGIKAVYNRGDILFGKLRPYFKKVGITAVDGVCSTDILVLKPKNQFENSYILLNLIQDKFIEYTTSTATGTRMPRTGWNQMGRYSIVIPPNNLLAKFDDIISPMLIQVQEIIHENIYLVQLRDALLPKLLSGEIDIREESVVG